MSDRKKGLVESRLRLNLQKLNLTDFSEYRLLLDSVQTSPAEIQNFINLLTTNKTDFFREPQHFNYIIQDLIPRWIHRKKPVSIWSCASSTGEEPYTLSMVIEQNTPPDFAFHILATDIDTKVLKKAKNGVYPQEKLKEIPERYQEKSISIGTKSAEGFLKLRKSTYKKINFQHHNLIATPALAEEKFDLIVCRNVMIYFKSETIEALMTKLHGSLKKNGILFIGHAESIAGNEHLFKSIQPAIYQKV